MAKDPGWCMAGCIAVALTILLALTVPVTAAAPTVFVSNYTVTPAVLMPGDEGVITVVLTSTAPIAPGSAFNIQVDSGGVNASQDVPTNAYIESVMLVSEEIEDLSGNYQDIGEIGPGQSFPLTFSIRAPDAEGIYFPEVWVRVRDSAGVRYPIPVNVNSAHALTKRPALRVEKIIPSSVDPGEAFTVTFVLQNEGEASANDISVNVNASSGVFSSKSPESHYIPILEPGEKANFSLVFETDINAQPGLEPISVAIDYLSPDLALFREIATIGVPLLGRAEMGVASMRTEPTRISAGDPVDLTIRIENTGTADAKSVRATISDLDFSGVKEAFLGTIEAGNDGPATFSLEADREGEFPYTLTIWYTDDYGEHVTRQSLSVVVAEPDTLPIAAIAIVVVIAGVAIIWYLRRREE